jgi:hypothetical protein
MRSAKGRASKITSRKIPWGKRRRLLSKHFGRDWWKVQCKVYDIMGELATEYTCGFWSSYELSNGGLYVAPEFEKSFQIHVESNGFEGSMSADAAGITACLFAFSRLSFQMRNESIGEHYHLLLDFALEHAEGSWILAAID